MSDFRTEPTTSEASTNSAVLNEETVSPQDWIALAKSDRSKFMRKQVMKLYAKANGFADENQLVDDLRAKKINPYASAKKFMDSLNGRSPNTRSSYRSLIKPFFDACVGEDSYKKTVFDRLVPAEDVYNLKNEGIPKMEHVEYMVS